MADAFVAGAFAAVERVCRAGVFGIGWWVVKTEGRGEGLWRAVIMASRVVGMVKGANWDGIEGGSGGSFEGVERTRRGASRRGSTCLR